MRLVVSILLLVCCISGWSAPSSVDPLSGQPQAKTCPQINQLVLDPQGMMWSAKGGWKTFVVSFATKINRFLGAQWEGVKVGNVYCLYQGNKMTFNIKLQYPGLALMPLDGHWSKDLGGYKNCISTDIANCQFIPYQKKSTGNIYQTLSELKSFAPQQPSF